MTDLVVAVTRNGLGDVWLFDSFEQADQHPIVQYGDVIMSGPHQIVAKYTMLEVPDLLRRLGNEQLRTEVLMKLRGLVDRGEIMRRYSPQMWEILCSMGRRPPEDPAEVVSIIVQDRVTSLTDRRAHAKESKMSAKTMTDEEKAAAAAEKKAKAEAKASEPKTVAGYRMDQKVTLLVDDKGVPFGPTNNPKRPGSKSAERFANYKNGLTVEETLLAGVLGADLTYDVNKNFIKID